MSANDLFKVPPGSTADVRIIDTTTSIKRLPLTYLMRPSLEGMPHMPEVPTWSFLVENATGKKALFDLGVPPNYLDYAPAITDTMKTSRDWEVHSEKHVADILKEHEIEPSSIDSIIWR